MKLYLDDNLASRSLASLLRKSGHTATIPADAGTADNTDAQHLAYTATSSLTCMTGDHGDFLDLHLLVRATGGRHCGILTVRRDNDPTRDMKDRDIVRALANLERAGVAIDNELIVLNHWR